MKMEQEPSVADSGQHWSQAYTLDSAFDTLNISSQGVQSFMLTNILRPAINNAVQRFYTKSETMASAMLAQGVTQRNVQWSTEASMWSTVAQPLMTFFEGFVYAITPFVAILCCLGMF